VEWSVEQAKARGFARITANLWEDNLAARSLFEKQGFLMKTLIELVGHPELSHTGGSLLMGLTFG
jgi:hypothetical protein